MKRILVSILFVLVAGSGGWPSTAQGAPEKFYREGLIGVDFFGLDAVAKERALQVLNSNRCDCGCGMTIAQCRVEDRSSRSSKLAAAVVDAIRSGQNDQQAVAVLKRMTDPAAVQGQTAPLAAPAATPPAQPIPRVEISTEGAPSIGPENAPVTLAVFSDFQ